MITSNACLLDTNVLVYAADESSKFHDRSRNLLEQGLAGAITLCITPQNLSEFYAIVTDPKRVDNPRTQPEALAEIKKYLSSRKILKIYPGPELTGKMIELLERYTVKRQEVFDLQLAATMLANGVSCIYTFNGKHFSKFSEIKVLEP
jgi:predicted nucleic acid-binding protein